MFWAPKDPFCQPCMWIHKKRCFLNMSTEYASKNAEIALNLAAESAIRTAAEKATKDAEEK